MGGRSAQGAAEDAMLQTTPRCSWRLSLGLVVGVPTLIRGRRDLLRYGIPLARRVHLTPRGLIY